jgi:two-component system nitrogen regulation sensor histidine kinase GlnL
VSETAPDAERQLASLALAFILIRPDLAIASVNPAAEQLIGASAKRVVGRPVSEILEFEEARILEWVGQGDAQLSAHGVPIRTAQQAARQFDLTLSPVTGSQGWQVLTLQPSGSSARLDGDATALRAPAILAHEIKNPLSAIRGAAQLLARQVEDAGKAMTGLITDEVDRIAKLVDRMQSLGREQPEPVEPCNLHEVIRRARSVVEAAGDEGVTLVEEFDPSLPPVLGNAEGLVQVLINLISNARDACKAVPEPRIVLRTRFVSGFVMNALRFGRPIKLPIEIRVSDNGPGVDPALAEHIFEPFVSSKKNGQGLGLALVKKLVRDMNGRISHERDAEGGWTHFSIHLPMAKPVAEGRV